MQCIPRASCAVATAHAWPDVSSTIHTASEQRIKLPPGEKTDKFSGQYVAPSTTMEMVEQHKIDIINMFVQTAFLGR